MIIAPGAHKITVSLPGYQTFETEINALPKQKVEVKTNLLRSNENAGATDSLMKSGSNNHAPIPPPDPLPPPQR
jgi:hypothetical protein